MNRPVETPLPGLALGEVGSKAHKMGTVFPSLSRASGASYTSDVMNNYSGAGVRLFVDVTDVGAGPGTVTVKIQVRDPASGAWKDLGATTAALNAVATTLLTVYPGIDAVANSQISTHLGLEWRVVATVATNAVVFSVGALSLE